MSLPLPYRNVSFCNDDEQKQIAQEFEMHKGSNLCLETSSVGYALEVDLSFPSELANYFSTYPPVATKRKIDPSEYSPHTSALVQDQNLKKCTTAKLLTDLYPKKNFHLHAINLKQLLQIGVSLDKVHRVVRFDQKPWLSEYINFNNSKRKISSSKFEKDYYKLCNNR